MYYSQQGLNGVDGTCFMPRSSHQNLTCFCDCSTQKNKNTEWKSCLFSYSFLQEGFGCPKICDFSHHPCQTHLFSVWVKASDFLKYLFFWASQVARRHWELGDLNKVPSICWYSIIIYSTNECMNAWNNHLEYFKIMTSHNYMKFSFPEMRHRLKFKIN